MTNVTLEECGACIRPRVEVGGTGLERVTPSLSKRSIRSRPFASVRLSLQIGAFVFAVFAATEGERTLSGRIGRTDFSAFKRMTLAMSGPAFDAALACF